MNILQLISSGGFYGAEAMVLHLSRALRDKGHRVQLGVFVNRRNPNDEIAKRARDLQFEVITLPCNGKLDISTVKQIRSYSEQNQVEVLHSHGYKSNLYALAANCLTRRALVSTCHNWTDQTSALRLYSTIDRMGLRFFDKVICVSEEVRTKLLRSGVPDQKAEVILNGIPVSDFANNGNRKTEEEPVIGMVGRLVDAKGFQLVLQSAPAILRRFPKARFVLVGEGPQREKWTRLVGELGIASRVAFVGAQTDMPRVYQNMSIFVLPSFNEGMPMTVLEAMAAGVPVVATKVGSIPQVIQHERTGLLIEKCDTNGVQSAIERLLGEPEFGLALGRRARSFVENQASAEKTADQYICHYQDLVSSNAALGRRKTA